MPDRVEDYVSRALREMDRSECPWGRALVQIDLARSAVLRPEEDLERAVSLVIDALDTFPGEPMVPVRTRAAEFADDIASRWGDSPHLETARAVISEMGAVSGTN
ncbi:hypothetical protein [Nocardia sp. NBC_01329]|uniref:hypothetical protein n=1 Tax=Nocardia sp. NBC_01329 TaxID=2903594 RepID=UPI002E0E43A6|nr:hypothetical protein OG405_23940 [Nocardia sp. NBC_01329]